jgi:hypothetical protein
MTSPSYVPEAPRDGILKITETMLGRKGTGFRCPFCRTFTAKIVSDQKWSCTNCGDHDCDELREAVGTPDELPDHVGNDQERGLDTGDAAAAVARSLQGKAGTVRVVEPVGGAKDVSNRLDAGHTLDELPDHAWPDETPNSNSAKQCRKALSGEYLETWPLNDIPEMKVEWFWKDYVSIGVVTVLEGDPGVGKSAVALDLAARVSTGREMPDGTPGIGPARVLILSQEDPLAEIRRRLEAAGADLDNVNAGGSIKDVDETGELISKPVVFPDHVDCLKESIQQNDVKLVIIDGYFSYLSPKLDMHKDSDMRRALTPLAKMADETGCAVILIRHLNKSGNTNPTYRGMGSVATTAVARSVLLAAKDPDDSTRYILTVSSSNLTAKHDGIAYRTASAPDSDIVRVVWEGTSHHTAESLLRASASFGAEHTARTEAENWLRDFLSDGPKPAAEVQTEALAAGHTERTLRRAKDSLGVRSQQVGRQWVWSLPGHTPTQHKPASEGQMATPEGGHLTGGRRDEGAPGEGGGAQGRVLTDDEYQAFLALGLTELKGEIVEERIVSREGDAVVGDEEG